MSKMKSLVLGSVLAASTVASGAAVAGASGNIGYVSDYFFRGIYQTTSSASAGLDYDFGSGLAVGIWAADVDEGIEYDIYGSFSGEVGELGYSIGFTQYEYTDDWDDTYSEVNLGLSYGPLSIEYSVGEYDGFGTPVDYTFTGVTLENKGAYITFGSFGDEAEGSYTEVGYGMEVGGFDVGVAIINNDEDLDVRTTDGDGETAMTLSLSKSFDL